MSVDGRNRSKFHAPARRLVWRSVASQNWNSGRRDLEHDFLVTCDVVCLPRIGIRNKDRCEECGLDRIDCRTVTVTGSTQDEQRIIAVGR